MIWVIHHAISSLSCTLINWHCGFEIWHPSKCNKCCNCMKHFLHKQGPLILQKCGNQNCMDWTRAWIIVITSDRMRRHFSPWRHQLQRIADTKKTVLISNCTLAGDLLGVSKVYTLSDKFSGRNKDALSVRVVILLNLEYTSVQRIQILIIDSFFLLRQTLRDPKESLFFCPFVWSKLLKFCKNEKQHQGV